MRGKLLRASAWLPVRQILHRRGSPESESRKKFCNWGIISGLYRDNGKENGSYYIISGKYKVTWALSVLPFLEFCPVECISYRISHQVAHEDPRTRIEGLRFYTSCWGLLAHQHLGFERPLCWMETRCMEVTTTSSDRIVDSWFSQTPFIFECRPLNS